MRAAEAVKKSAHVQPHVPATASVSTSRKGAPQVKARILILGAAVMALAPTFASAQTAPGQGQFNGQGYNHMNGPSATGQPDQSCQDINGGNTGPYYPGNTSTAPGSAFHETDGLAGTMYAGSQPQSERNSASVSQYDVACFEQSI